MIINFKRLLSQDMLKEKANYLYLLKYLLRYTALIVSWFTVLTSLTWNTFVCHAPAHLSIYFVMKETTVGPFSHTTRVLVDILKSNTTCFNATIINFLFKFKQGWIEPFTCHTSFFKYDITKVLKPTMVFDLNKNKLYLLGKNVHKLSNF